MAEHEHNEKCREVFALLSRYIDVDLPPDVCREIEAHIAGCSPCVEFTESLKKTVEMCRNYSPGDLPVSISLAAKESLRRAWEKLASARGTG